MLKSKWQSWNLADSLADPAGVLRFSVGVRSTKRRPRLRLVVGGSLTLRCQRCLGGLQWPVDIEVCCNRCVKEEIPDEQNDEVDALEVGSDLDVIGLVEEEVLWRCRLRAR